MRKILTIAFTLISFQLVISQTVLNEDFGGTTWPPAGWSVINQTGNWSRSQTNTAGGSAPEARLSWTPQFNATTRFVSPAINLTGYSKVIVKFRHSVDHYTASYQIGMATRSGGALGIWNNIWTLPVSGAIGAEQKIFVVENSDVNQPDFQIGFFFTGNSYNLNYWYIDNVEVNLVPELDAAMSSLNVPDMFAGTQSVTGSVFNLGSTIITSLNVNWQINDGTVNTTPFSGLNILTAESYNFTCSQQINLDPGTYQLKAWVSDVNALNGDDVPENDTIIKTISVVNQANLRKPLFEEFTSSTCGPCASFNNSVMNPFFNQYGQNFTLIKYQMSWPGSGDPYYTAEGGVRRTYYGVNAVPMMFIEGSNIATNMGAVTNAYNAALNTPAFMEINSQHIIDGYDITVKSTITPQVAISNAIVHIVVVENTTVNNVGSNGETSFKHVMMKMLPNANGTVVNFIAGEPLTLQYSHNMSTTFVEEMNDLSVIVFVQNNANKSVYQSAYSTHVISFGLPGDANCDGTVNVLDVVNMIDFILGNNPQPFCLENADVNNDGAINVIDVVGTVNIIIGGKKSANIPVKSESAFLNISNEKISLHSDGTLAGLQFELKGVQKAEISCMLEGYEVEMAENEEIITVIIFSFNNRPLPGGSIDLLSFNQKASVISWGEALAANVNANEVKVIKKLDGEVSSFSDLFRINTFPNPSERNINVEISSQQMANVRMTLMDMTGKELTTLLEGTLSVGNHMIGLNEDSGLSSGIYFINFFAIPEGSDTAFKKSIKVMIVR